MSNSRRYIGVDLGAWYNNKTKIAVLKEDEKDQSRLVLDFLDSEPLKITRKRKPKPEERNKGLIRCIWEKANKNALIAIDAPFAIPSALSKNTEDYHSIECTPALKNQYLYDNSARFVYEKTKRQVSVLAPTATLVGALTARMVHIVDNYSRILGICKTPYLKERKKSVSTIEVFPRATLMKIIVKHIELEMKKIPEYKNKKNEKDHFEYQKGTGKDNMLSLIRDYIKNIDEFDIKTDDDYDAIICALTAYWVDKNGYEEPKDQDKDKFTNSFIYIPIITQK